PRAVGRPRHPGRTHRDPRVRDRTRRCASCNRPRRHARNSGYLGGEREATGPRHRREARDTMSRSRTSLPGLLARAFRAALGPLLAMAAIVLLVATLASTAPLALRSLTSAEVAYQFENLPASRRDLVARAPGTPAITASTTPYA